MVVKDLVDLEEVGDVTAIEIELKSQRILVKHRVEREVAAARARVDKAKAKLKNEAAETKARVKQLKCKVTKAIAQQNVTEATAWAENKIRGQ